MSVNLRLVEDYINDYQHHFEFHVFILQHGSIQREEILKLTVNKENLSEYDERSPYRYFVTRIAAHQTNAALGELPKNILHRTAAFDANLHRLFWLFVRLGRGKEAL